MADTFITLADLVKINDLNANDDGISDLLTDAPVLRMLSAIEASNGTDHKFLKETSAPVVGFRDPNDGLENTAGVDTLVTINLKILDASFAIDVAIADAFAKGGAPALLDRETGRHLKQSFSHAERQIFNGTGNEGDGFTGLSDNTGLDDSDDEMVVDAGGTTASTGASCWLIRHSNDQKDAAVVAGNDGLIEVKEAVVVKGDGSSTGTLPQYYVPILGWLGFQVGGARSIGRICNLTEDSGKGLTDALIYSALSKFPASRQPNLIVCNRRSLEQLRASRTATNQLGTPAPRPVDVDGIPLVSTDSLDNTETLLTPA